MSRDLAAALACAVRAALPQFDGVVTAAEQTAEPWASITFAGARHRLVIALDGDGAVGAAADLLAVLGELEVPLAGRIVADIALLAEGRRDDGRHASLDVELLTIDES